MTDTSVKYFNSAMGGAPALSGQAGKLIDVLDACLINGWGIVNVDQIVVSANVAVATINSGHYADVDTVVALTGSGQANLNGQFRVSAKTTSSVTFATSGVPDGTYTGSVTLKIASAGWEKAFSGTNKAAYRCPDLTISRCLLRIDDTATTYARASGYDAMTTIDAGTNRFPTDAQLSGGGYFYKSDAANTTARNWWVIATDRFFYLGIAYSLTYQAYGGGEAYAFGDFPSRKPADVYPCVIFPGTATPWVQGRGSPIADTNLQGYLARSTDQATVSPLAYPTWIHARGVVDGSSGKGSLTYPSPCDNALTLTPIFLFEGTTILRGMLPGVYATDQAVNAAFAMGEKLQGVIPGRTFVAQRVAGYSNQYTRTLFFDITGPWT